MLVDRASILVRSGRGGDGAVSFLRMKYVPKGGPNGGDGGNGGSVYLLASPGVDTLLDFQGRPIWRAESGRPGGGKQCHGRDGTDLDVAIPPGTLVYDEETDELIADLDVPGKRVCVAQGGRGGFGNEHFKSATNQTPREASPGEAGEERRLRLELKLIADVGLIGKPNAGKSTLLSRLSRATPKIADYPFTTLEPQLGIAELPGYRRLVIADIPGLIEGAADGAGLGHDFLRHIERTKILVHLIEIEPTDGSDPIGNYRAIRHELASYSPELAAKDEILVLSKAETLPDEGDRQAALELLQQEGGLHPMLLSSVTGEGTQELLELCWQRLRSAEQQTHDSFKTRPNLSDPSAT
jgi:GTP-binding protein